MKGLRFEFPRCLDSEFLIQRLNGDVLQDSRTSNLIFDIPTLISCVSRVMTLRPGDLILTGTPDGVGVSAIPRSP